MEKKQLVEATLFMAAKPMSLDEIQAVVGLPKEEVTAILEELKDHYDKHGFRVVEHPTTEGKLFELRIKDEYARRVGHLAPTSDFSRGVLQTLSLIAYRAPIKQSEVVRIRGNRAYEHVKELEERGFIRREPKGRTKLITLARKFMDYFGLGNLQELKKKFDQIVAEAKKEKAEGK